MGLNILLKYGWNIAVDISLAFGALEHHQTGRQRLVELLYYHEIIDPKTMAKKKKIK